MPDRCAELSICIPYYSGRAYLERCLRSIDRNPPSVQYDVVVIDDAGPEPCGETASPATAYLSNRDNVGYGASVNRGAAATRGRFLLALNSDAEVQPGSLDRMLECLRNEPDVAGVGPMVLNTDGTFQAQCRRGRLTPWSGLLYATGLDRFQGRDSGRRYIDADSPIDAADDVEALSGCCMMLRRSAIEAAEGFDEDLKLYGEDLDLCYRLRDAGWRLRYQPQARALHHGGCGGTNARFWHARYHYHRSLARLFAKHGSPWYSLYGWLVSSGLALRLIVTCALAPLRARGAANPKRKGRPVGAAAH